MLGFTDFLFYFIFLNKAVQSWGTFQKGIIKFKALLTARRLFCNIPAYLKSLYLISAPCLLTLIKSGCIAYQVLSRVCVLPPQQRKLLCELISLSLGSSVLIGEGAQKYLFHWMKSLTFSHESGAAGRKSHRHNFKRTGHKKSCDDCKNSLGFAGFHTKLQQRASPTALEKKKKKTGSRFRIKMVAPFYGGQLGSK